MDEGAHKRRRQTMSTCVFLNFLWRCNISYLQQENRRKRKENGEKWGLTTTTTRIARGEESEATTYTLHTYETTCWWSGTRTVNPFDFGRPHCTMWKREWQPFFSSRDYVCTSSHGRMSPCTDDFCQMVTFEMLEKLEKANPSRHTIITPIFPCVYCNNFVPAYSIPAFHLHHTTPHHSLSTTISKLISSMNGQRRFVAVNTAIPRPYSRRQTPRNLSFVVVTYTLSIRQSKNVILHVHARIWKRVTISGHQTRDDAYPQIYIWYEQNKTKTKRVTQKEKGHSKQRQSIVWFFFLIGVVQKLKFLYTATVATHYLYS